MGVVSTCGIGRIDSVSTMMRDVFNHEMNNVVCDMDGQITVSWFVSTSIPTQRSQSVFHSWCKT